MSVDLFDANFYRAANSDLAAAGLTTDTQLRSHFQNFGIDAGRLFSPFANINFYRASNPDLAAAGLTTNRQALNHLQNNGVAEGRNFSQFVDINFYLNTNSDVNQAYQGNKEQALEHLRSFGINEGRIFSPFIGFVDQNADETLRGLNYYLQLNPDVNQAVKGSRVRSLEHLEIYGVNETRSFSPFVDLGYYLAANQDVNQAFSGNRGGAFDHLVRFGVNEPRQWSPAFNVDYYRATNPDLRDAGITSGRQLFEHWQSYGVLTERRFGTPVPGNSPDTALNLDSPDTSITVFNGFVGTANSTDYYRFTLTQSRNIIVQLTNMSDDLGVALYDTSGNILQYSKGAETNSKGPETNSDAISYLNLNPGTYSIGVYHTAGSKSLPSSYSLELGIVVSQEPGNTLKTAYPIYSLNDDFYPTSTISIKGTIANNGPDDYYQFNLTTTTVFYTGISRPDFISPGPIYRKADLFLLDSTGSEISSSVENDYMFDMIDSTTLNPGTYFIRVKQRYSNNFVYDPLNYELILSADLVTSN